jgi:CheY-like chemotaxis protein
MNPTAHILIIDDIPLNLEVLGSSLAGYDIQFATSGPQALKLVREQLPDLILLDVMMPGIDGYQVLQILQGDPVSHGVPVIFVTSQCGSASETRALEAGGGRFHPQADQSGGGARPGAVAPRSAPAHPGA